MENNQLEYKSDIPKKPNQLKAEIVSFIITKTEKDLMLKGCILE